MSDRLIGVAFMVAFGLAAAWGLRTLVGLPR
jgi:hypothetical protein